MTGYVLGEDADLDLDEIWEYIAADDVDAADRWVGKLFDAFETLGKAPGIGHKREDLTAYPVLFWPVGNYLIIYRFVSAFSSHRSCGDYPGFSRYPLVLASAPR